MPWRCSMSAPFKAVVFTRMTTSPFAASGSATSVFNFKTSGPPVLVHTMAFMASLVSLSCSLCLTVSLGSSIGLAACCGKLRHVVPLDVDTAAHESATLRVDLCKTPVHPTYRTDSAPSSSTAVLLAESRLSPAESLASAPRSNRCPQPCLYALYTPFDTHSVTLMDCVTPEQQAQHGGGPPEVRTCRSIGGHCSNCILLLCQ